MTADALCSEGSGEYSFCRLTPMRLVPEGSIVVERGVGEHEGEWPEWALRVVDYEANHLGGEALRILDGLARGFFSEV